MSEVRRINYGDVVGVTTKAPNRYNPGAVGCVYLVDEAPTPQFANKTGADDGEVIFCVEVKDGSSFCVPAKFLRLIEAEGED